MIIYLPPLYFIIIILRSYLVNTIVKWGVWPLPALVHDPGPCLHLCLVNIKIRRHSSGPWRPNVSEPGSVMSLTPPHPLTPQPPTPVINSRGNRMLIERRASFSGRRAALSPGRSRLQMRGSATPPHKAGGLWGPMKAGGAHATHTAMIMMGG